MLFIHIIPTASSGNAEEIDELGTLDYSPLQKF